MDLALKRTLVVIGGIILIGGTTWYFVDRERKQDEAEQNTPAIVSEPNPRIGDSITPDTPTPPTTDDKMADKPAGDSMAGQNGGHGATAKPTSPTAYRNERLRFSFIVPASWEVAEDQHASNQVHFFNQDRRTTYGGVEVFTNHGHESVDSLEQMIQRSPTVTGTERVVYRGHEGVGYWNKGEGQEHFIFVVNDHIYYIEGEEVLTRLNFI